MSSSSPSHIQTRSLFLISIHYQTTNHSPSPLYKTCNKYIYDQSATITKMEPNTCPISIPLITMIYPSPLSFTTDYPRPATRGYLFIRNHHHQPLPVQKKKRHKQNKNTEYIVAHTKGCEASLIVQFFLPALRSNKSAKISQRKREGCMKKKHRKRWHPLRVS